MLGGGTACLALVGTAGFALQGRVAKVGPLHAPMAGSKHAPKVWTLPGALPANPEGPWAFRSRPDLSPPAVEVTREAHDDTASGYVFVSPQEGDTAQGGSLTVDDGGRRSGSVPFRVRSDGP